MSYIKKLKDLTAGLPNQPCAKERRYEEYEIMGGVSKSWGLLKIPEVAVAHTYLPKDSVFDRHDHKAPIREYVIVYSGAVRFGLNGEEVKIVAPGHLVIETKVPHWCKAIEDSWVIAITVPMDEGFPNA